MQGLLEDRAAVTPIASPAAAPVPAPRVRAASLRRRILFPLLASCMSLIAACAVAEITLRVCGYGRSYTNPMGSFFVPDNELGYHGKANFTGRFRRADFDVIVEHDENGFRRGETDNTSDPRVVYVLGDSFVWGYGIGQHDLLTNQMARRLGRHVHNFGLIGAGTVQEFLIFQKHVAPRLRPGDTVVLVFFGNDFGDNVGKHLAGRVYATISEGRIQLVPPRPATAAQQWKNWMKDAWCIFNLASYCIDGIQYSRKNKDLFDSAGRRTLSPAEIAADTSECSPAVAITRHYLAALRDVCRAKQARFLTVLVPGQAELSEDDVTSTSDLCLAEEIASREAFERLAGELRLATVDLMAPMLSAKRSGRFERLTFVHDFHWNPAGNTIAAEVIAADIARRDSDHALDPR